MSTHHKTVLSSNYTRLLFDQRDQMFFIAKVWYQENITVDYKKMVPPNDGQARPWNVQSLKIWNYIFDVNHIFTWVRHWLL